MGKVLGGGSSVLRECCLATQSEVIVSIICTMIIVATTVG